MIRFFPLRRQKKIAPALHMKGFGAITFLFYVFLYTPLIFLVIFSFNAGRSTSVWQGFTIKWFEKVFGNSALLEATYNSLVIAGSVSIVATFIGLVTALGYTRTGGFKGKRASYVFLHTPLILPEILTAVATLSLFAFIGLRQGILNVMIAHLPFCIVFAFIPIYARLKDVGQSLEKAAADLYASPIRVFWQCTLPSIFPAIVSGFMLSFVMSMDDFIITMMVAEPGVTTLPLYIYGLLKAGVTPEVNALSSLVLLLSIGLIIFATVLQKKR